MKGIKKMSLFRGINASTLETRRLENIELIKYNMEILLKEAIRTPNKFDLDWTSKCLGEISAMLTDHETSPNW